MVQLFGQFVAMSTAKSIEVLNKSYLYDDMLARALVQLLPQEERPRVIVWLDKLQTISGDRATLLTRNDYTWLLLLALQSGKLTEPFDNPPPNGLLPPISDIMPPRLFQEMLSSSEQNYSWIDDLISGADNGNDSVSPRGFHERQPQPVNGISCYFSVFSKQ